MKKPTAKPAKLVLRRDTLRALAPAEYMRAVCGVDGGSNGEACTAVVLVVPSQVPGVSACVGA